MDAKPRIGNFATMGIYDLVSSLGLAKFRRKQKPLQVINGKQRRQLNGRKPPQRLQWASRPEHEAIFRRHYGSKRPEIIAAMVAPLYPDFKITANMVIGRANRMGLRKERNSAEE